jgi:hypothetical protein
MDVETTSTMRARAQGTNMRKGTAGTRTGQMELVAGILHMLSKMGMKELTTRQVNACISAADSIKDALDKDDVPATQGMGLRAWLACDDRGASSNYLASRLCCVPVQQRDVGAYPHDANDFGRCYRFLRAVRMEHTTRLDIEHMSTCTYPHWRVLAANWAALEHAYETALQTKDARSFNALLSTLYDGIEQTEVEAKQ